MRAKWTRARAALVATCVCGCGGTLQGGAGGGDAAGGNDSGEDDGGGPIQGEGGTDPCVQMGLPSTTVSGVVYDLAGNNPVFNVIVFVPGAPLEPFPNGVTCARCGAVSGSPITAALTDASGKFALTNVPPGDNVPLVMQIGKWRRKVTVPHVTACATTQMDDPSVMHLPGRKSEGDMPQIAVATGGCDPFECVLRKIGIDDAEFTDQSGDGKVHVFQGGVGGAPPGTPAGASISASTASAQSFWANAQGLLDYDVVINACECVEHEEEKPQAAIDNLMAYANAGGRVFTTHFQYFWFDPTIKVPGETSSWTPSGNWTADHDMDNGTEAETVDDSFPKGKAFSEWLVTVGASTTPSQLPITQTRYNITSVNPPAIRWIQGTDPTSMMPAIMDMTFNAPWSAPADQQCGKVLFSDFHSVVLAGQGPWGPAVFPDECDTMPMSPQEKALEFMLFDLSSCIQDDTSNLVPPQ